MRKFPTKRFKCNSLELSFVCCHLSDKLAFLWLVTKTCTWTVVQMILTFLIVVVLIDLVGD